MAGNSKNVLLPFAVVAAGDMSASITSPPTNVQYLDNIIYTFVWTGSPTGTFAFQVSEDYQPGTGGTVINAGTWIPLTLSATIAATGGADNALIDLNQLPGSWVRFVYTRSSGTGTLAAYISGKAV